MAIQVATRGASGSSHYRNWKDSHLVLIIIIIIKSIYKAPCLRVIKPAQRRYTKVHSIPE